MKFRATVLSLSFVAAASCANNARVSSCEGACGVGMICNTTSGQCVSTTVSFPGSGMPCEVAALLENHCVSCHGTTPSGGAPNSLVTRDDLMKTAPAGGTYASRAVVRIRDTQSPMPPSDTGDSVSDSEFAALQGWVNGRYASGACAAAGSSPTGGGGGAGGGDGSTGGGDASAGGGAATGGGFVSGGGTASGGGAGAAGGGAGVTNFYCAPCTSDGDCGGGNNFCISFTFGDYCGTDCSNVTCGAGQRCANIVDSSNTVLGKDCVPATGSTCAGATGGGAGSTGGGSGSMGGGAGSTGGGTGSTDAGVCTTDTWSSWAQNFFNTRCNSCHQHTGEFTQAYVLSRKTSISSRINSGNMPQGSSLSAADKQRILKYLSCGVP